MSLVRANCLIMLSVHLCWMSHLYLCKSASLLITSFQFHGKCFWLIYRFKTILLALCWNPWIWIACPPSEYIGRRFFFLFSFGNQQLKVSRSLNAFFFSQAHEEAEDFFFTHHPTFIPFFPHQFKHFWIYFFVSGCLYPHISFFSLVTPINKKW